MQKTAEEKKREKDRIYRGAAGILQVLLGILAVVMLLHWNSDAEPSNLQQALHGSYSDGQNAAEFIREEISPDEIILSTDVPMESTILAYLKDYRFYYAGSGKITTYADWTESDNIIGSGNCMVQGKLPGERLYLSYTEHGLLYCGSGEAGWTGMHL